MLFRSALPVFSLLLSTQVVANRINQTVIEPLNKPHKAWRGLVSAAAYRVLFEEHTEEPGSSELNYEQREGVFIYTDFQTMVNNRQHK